MSFALKIKEMFSNFTEVERASDLSKIDKIMLKIKFGADKRKSFYDKISSYLDSGINAFDTLGTISSRYKKNKDIRYKLLDFILERMRQGSNFSDCITGLVPEGEQLLIYAGEKGKGLSQGFKEAAVLAESTAAIKRIIYVGVAMPIFLIIVLGLMMIGFQMKMVPVFITLMPVDQWPDASKKLYNLSYFVYAYWPFIFIALIMLSMLIYATLGTWTGKIRALIFDKIPPWSVYKNFQASSFLLSLASLLNSGTPLSDGLSMLNKNSSKWLAIHLDIMLESLRTGKESPGKAMNTGMLDNETAGDIEDYAQLSNFEQAMTNMGKKMVTESVIKIGDKMAVLRNLFLFIIAAFMVWIYASTYALQTKIAENQQSRSK